LYIDEAHATGLFGHGGAGLASGRNGVKLIMGTFSKAMGSFGAYVACSDVMRQYLVNFCSGIIYSTALPPPVLGAIDAALDLIPQLDEERLQLQQMALSLRESITRLGFQTLPGCTPIIPIITGADESALALASYLEDSGMLAPAIRPPTVPDGTARVRLSISTAHTKDDIDLLLQCLKSWAPGAVS
jgi:8-amino-7-oxononanoate synthase